MSFRDQYDKIYNSFCSKGICWVFLFADQRQYQEAIRKCHSTQLWNSLIHVLFPNSNENLFWIEHDGEDASYFKKYKFFLMLLIKAESRDMKSCSSLLHTEYIPFREITYNLENMIRTTISNHFVTVQSSVGPIIIFRFCEKPFFYHQNKLFWYTPEVVFGNKIYNRATEYQKKKQTNDKNSYQ